MSKRLAAFLCLVPLCACAPQVVTQSVPVSTDPGGANVAVDGKAACTAPCQVDLPRNQDHIITLTREGYRQQDIIVKRQYQTGKVLINAINEGANSANFFKNGWFGANSAVSSMNTQESTGEAYVLVPSTVSVRLTPTGGFPAKTTQAQAQAAQRTDISPLDIMDVGDQQMLENALETSRSGQTTAWRNQTSGAGFSMVAEPAQEADGEVVRWFTLAARQGANTATGRFPAHRVGRGEWVLSLPNQQPEAGASDPGADAQTRRETVRALGQTQWPSAKKSWDVGSSGSSRTTTSTSADGSSTTTKTTSTKTSVKAGVNVTPGAVVGLLDALGGLGE